MPWAVRAHTYPTRDGHQFDLVSSFFTILETREGLGHALHSIQKAPSSINAGIFCAVEISPEKRSHGLVWF